MNDFQYLSSQKKIFIYNQGSLNQKDFMTPFALTDTLTTYAGLHQQPIIHFWQLSHAMILGMKDSRVPNLKKGLVSLNKVGYSAVLRNSGGLGVIADAGVLNISLILPNVTEKKLTIDSAYSIMWAWLKVAYESDRVKIDAFEITDSYCPGTFDLSINGKKFAGIAQRRVKDGIAIMIYLSINGNQKKRGEAVEHFYRASLGNAFGLNGYPPVNPEVMANLEELIHQPLTIEAVTQQLLSVFAVQQLDYSSISKVMAAEAFQTDLGQQTEKMKIRNNALNFEE